MPTTKPVSNYTDIEGWFNWQDRMLFDVLLESQEGQPGTLVELGAYLGRSAVIVGDHRQPGERFVIVDLFGEEPGSGSASTPSSAANRRENQYSYRSLTQSKFEENYLALHAELPEVVQGLSTEVTKHVQPGEARFVHIDASHLYDQVAEDIVNVQSLLRPDGIVVFDDYRAEHTPGVAAAVWEAVANAGLVPFAITPHKLYGTWGDPTAHLEAVRSHVQSDDRVVHDEQVVHGHTIVRTRTAAKKKPAAPTPATTGRDDAGPDQRADTLAQRLAPLLRRSSVASVAKRRLRAALKRSR